MAIKEGDRDPDNERKENQEVGVSPIDRRNNETAIG
jgi:hypothetical protein